MNSMLTTLGAGNLKDYTQASNNFITTNASFGSEMVKGLEEAKKCSNCRALYDETKEYLMRMASSLKNEFNLDVELSEGEQFNGG